LPPDVHGCQVESLTPQESKSLDGSLIYKRFHLFGEVVYGSR
jgi:hypothetical protein